MDLAIDAHGLRGRIQDLTAAEQQRLTELDDLLSDEPQRLQDLSPEESDDVWHTAHRTGDPLADYWERQIARGETPDFDLTEVPDEE